MLFDHEIALNSTQYRTRRLSTMRLYWYSIHMASNGLHAIE